MNAILKHFLKFKVVSPPNCDKAFELDTFNSLKRLKRWIHMNWDLLKHGKHIFDDFYCKKLDIEDIRWYNKFLLVVKIILTLSHGQAATERGFSLGKSSLEVNIKENSIVAKKIVRERLSPSKQRRFVIFCKLIIACNTAHSKYKASLE